MCVYGLSTPLTYIASQPLVILTTVYSVNSKNEATVSFDVYIFLCVDCINMRSNCVFCVHMHMGTL